MIGGHMNKDTIWRTETKHMTMAELKEAVDYLTPYAKRGVNAECRLKDMKTEIRMRGVNYKSPYSVKNPDWG
jgi:hypothetical protein